MRNIIYLYVKTYIYSYVLAKKFSFEKGNKYNLINIQFDKLRFSKLIVNQFDIHYVIYNCDSIEFRRSLFESLNFTA